MQTPKGPSLQHPGYCCRAMRKSMERMCPRSALLVLRIMSMTSCTVSRDAPTAGMKWHVFSIADPHTLVPVVAVEERNVLSVSVQFVFSIH